jgi:hypothetical protein
MPIDGCWAFSTISGRAVPSARVPTIVLEDIGDPTQHILREAQRCDVVVLGRETHYHFETQDRPDATLGQVIRTSPRPVVVVPRELPEGRGIVVAYGGGREAARTLQIFESLGIADGEDVAVVTVHRDLAEAEGVAALAGDFLTVHGTAVELCPIASAAPRLPRSCSKRFAAAAPACS